MTEPHLKPPPAEPRRRQRPAPPKKDPKLRADHEPAPPKTDARPPTDAEDPDLARVAKALRDLDPSGNKAASAIREAFDNAYDPRRTGRWDYSQLMKTEKTHLGTLVEIWLQRAYELPDGRHLDYRIADIDVDCKWSRNLYEWEFPLEMYRDASGGHRHGLALVVWGNDHTEAWAMGLVRITEQLLRASKNRDQKRKLNDEGRDSILWIHRGKRLMPNTLLRHPDVALAALGESSGQKAVNALFRLVQGEIVNMAAVEACAQQKDSAKRVRDARLHKNLGKEGIVIFGHYAPQPQLCEALGLPRPMKGSFVSARLARWTSDDPEPNVAIDGERWRLARDSEATLAAPKLPEQRHPEGRE